MAKRKQLPLSANRFRFFNFSPQGASPEAFINRITYEQRNPEDEFVFSNPADHTLMFITSGAGAFYQKETCYSVTPGSILVRLKDFPLELYFSKPTELFLIGFNGKELVKQVRKALGPQSQVFPIANRSIIESYFQFMFAETQNSGPQLQRIVQNIFRAFLLKVADERHRAAQVTPLARKHYDRIRIYIDEHYLALSSLSEIASACSVSDSYLSRLFRLHVQITPYQYLIRLKINHSCQLLQNAENTIQGISEVVGFADVFTFSKAFKRTLNQSPSQYRKQLYGM